MATKLYLGFGKKLDAANVVSLKRQYLPLGKVGGKPAWLNPVNLPKIESISCKCCKKVMPLLLQIYCSADLDTAFHRYIYIYMCPNDACQKVSVYSIFHIYSSTTIKLCHICSLLLFTKFRCFRLEAVIISV